MVYLALGSNMGDSLALLTKAIEQLAAHPKITVKEVADVYRTTPVGYQDQDDFLNTVVQIETSLEPLALLKTTQAIENALGRVRTDEQNGPRTIDIDIVLFGERTIALDNLIIPHPRMGERRFVLQPLSDIDPAIEVPNLGDVSELLAATLDQVVEPLNVKDAFESLKVNG